MEKFDTTPGLDCKDAPLLGLDVMVTAVYDQDSTHWYALRLGHRLSYEITLFNLIDNRSAGADLINPDETFQLIIKDKCDDEPSGTDGWTIANPPGDTTLTYIIRSRDYEGDTVHIGIKGEKGLAYTMSITHPRVSGVPGMP